MEFEDNELDIEINSNTNNLSLESKPLEVQVETSNEAKVNAEIQENQISMETPQVITNTDHNKMINRNSADQHSIDAITGLRKELDNAGKVKDVLANGKSVVDEEGKANIEIPDTSEFIKNTVDNLVNYYKKSETYSKEEINQLAATLQNVHIGIVNTLPTTGETNVIYFVKKTGKENDIYDEWIYINSKWEHIGNTNIDLTGYATEQWVKDQNYMPIEDFQQIMEFFYYNKTEIDEKLNNLPEPSIPLEFDINANIFEENGQVKVFTNTGYIVDDNYIRLQPLADIGTTGINKIVYTDKEMIFVYDGSNKIRRFKNGIDFDVIELPVNCISMIYQTVSKRLIGTDGKGYFVYSDDDGDTWNIKQNSLVNGDIYLFQHTTFANGFAAINTATKRIIGFNENFAQNTTITSTIVPMFICLLNISQFIWCNNTGTFKYGAGSQEGSFVSLSGVNINILKKVNEKPMIGLKNSNKLYVIKYTDKITGNEWISYTLPATCTVNDIIFNPNDKTYYIFTDINTYYKTKDFVKYDSIDKNGLRGLQGDFTLMGIQTTTVNHNELLLAPTQIKIENILQEFKRGLDKTRWIGPGLELTGDQMGLKESDTIGRSANAGTFVKSGSLYYSHFSQDIEEKIRVATADIDPISPFDLDSWFWGKWDGNVSWCCNVIFTEEGTIYDPLSYAEEYTVEKRELGYFLVDNWGMAAPYTKRTSLGILFE